ncbi:type II secretion system protein [Candidatus Gracilibacteria bacterium]|nr:MAG: type II secretion system protein [Candidatus Gracilibacteria bacterium]
MKSKKAFSLIEIVIATGILSVTVFGIYKLIGENNKIISNSNIYLTQNQTFENAIQCLKGVKNLPGNYLDFGEDLKSCNFSSSEKITKIDGVEYSIFIEDKTDFWNIKIDSGNLKAETKMFPK